MSKIVSKLAVILLIFVSIWQLSILFKNFETFFSSPNEKEEINSSEIAKVIEDDGSKDTQDISIPEISFLPKKISIPSIDLALDIISVPLVDGTWEVKSDVANYAEGTSMVSDKGGNVGLYGHAREQEFLNIKNLLKGDIIEIYGDTKKAEYVVIESSIVTPEMVDVFYYTDKSSVTLVTCDGYYSDKRYVVRAELIQISENI